MPHFSQLDAFRGSKETVRLIGHRGARGILPENTIEGFEFTLSLGIKALEFDVVLTRDLVPVITHNHHLSAEFTRTPDGQFLSSPEPRVADLTLAELQSFDVGALDPQTDYATRFPDQAILDGARTPRLADLLVLVAQPKHHSVALLLELKSDPAQYHDAQARAQLVTAVIKDIRQHDLATRTVLHSFDWGLLDICRDLAPEMPTSYLSERPSASSAHSDDPVDLAGPDYANMTTSVPRAVAEAGGQMWCPYFKDVTAELVAEAHELGLLVQTWTVNAAADIEAMIDAGVDGVCSDYPGRVQRHLRARGLRWTD